jgi:predicted ATPase
MGKPVALNSLTTWPNGPSRTAEFSRQEKCTLAGRDFHVITGASGAGKSTLVAALADAGYATVKEEALALLQEQQRCKGNLLPWVDRPAFLEEVLARNVRSHQAAQCLEGPVFFDRAIPECLAWLELSDVTLNAHHRAAVTDHPYAHTVFVAEPWPEVYVRNADRQASFERAARSYEPTVAAYIAAGYRTCILPKVSVQERVAFVLAKIASGT